MTAGEVIALSAARASLLTRFEQAEREYLEARKQHEQAIEATHSAREAQSSAYSYMDAKLTRYRLLRIDLERELHQADGDLPVAAEGVEE